MKRTKLITLTYLILVILLLSACAHVIPIEKCITDKPYGFWSGLWHGIIAPISFIVSLFKADIAVYGINNNGAWYNLGFLLGVAIVFGGGGHQAKR